MAENTGILGFAGPNFEELNALKSPAVAPKQGLSPELMGIALDMVGKNLAPQNPFAGVGTAIGQSSLAGKKAAELRQEDRSFWDQLIGALSKKDQPGPTSLNFTQGENGLEFNLKGLGDSELGSLQTPIGQPEMQAQPASTGGMTQVNQAFQKPEAIIGNNIDEYIKSIGGYELPLT